MLTPGCPPAPAGDLEPGPSPRAFAPRALRPAQAEEAGHPFQAIPHLAAPRPRAHMVIKPAGLHRHRACGVAPAPISPLKPKAQRCPGWGWGTQAQGQEDRARGHTNLAPVGCLRRTPAFALWRRGACGWSPTALPTTPPPPNLPLETQSPEWEPWPGCAWGHAGQGGQGRSQVGQQPRGHLDICAGGRLCHQHMESEARSTASQRTRT